MKKNLCSIGTFGACLAINLLTASPLPLQANESISSSTSAIYSDSIAEDAKQEALNKLNSYATTIYQSNFFETDINQIDDFLLGEGFYQYFSNNGDVTKSGVIIFPVYQCGKPVFTIDVAKDKGSWYSSAGQVL